MRTRIHILCALLLAAGCTASRDSADCNITPGLGISNVVTVGMTTRDIKKATRGVVIEKYETGGCDACIPDLGVSWNVENMTDQVRRLDFLVNPQVYPESSPPWRLRRYSGTVAGRLSLEKPQSLTRQKVVGLFGEPQHAFGDVPPSELKNLAAHVRATVRDGESTSMITAPATEVLSYPAQGIGFALQSNVVYTLRVMWRVEPEH